MRKKIDKDQLRIQFIEDPGSCTQVELIWLFKNTKLDSELFDFFDSDSCELILFSPLKLIFKKINDMYSKYSFLSKLISKISINKENHDKVIDVIKKYNIDIPNSFINSFHSFINEELNTIQTRYNNLAISSLSKDKLTYEARLKVFTLFHKTNYQKNGPNLNSIFLEFLDFNEYVRIIKNLKEFDNNLYDQDINLLLSKFDNELIENLIDNYNLSLKHVYKVNRWLFTTNRYDQLLDVINYNKNDVVSNKSSILQRIEPSDTMNIFKDFGLRSYYKDHNFKNLIKKNNLIDLSLRNIETIQSYVYQKALFKFITPNQFKESCHDKLIKLSINSIPHYWLDKENSLFLINNTIIEELIVNKSYSSYSKGSTVELLFKNLDRNDLINSNYFFLEENHGYEHIDLIVNNAPHILTKQEWVQYISNNKGLFNCNTFKKVHKKIPSEVFYFLYSESSDKEIKAHFGNIKAHERRYMFAYIKECISSHLNTVNDLKKYSFSMNPNHISSMIASFKENNSNSYYLTDRDFGSLKNILFSVKNNNLQLSYFIEYLKDSNFYNDFIRKSNKQEKMTLLSNML